VKTPSDKADPVSHDEASNAPGSVADQRKLEPRLAESLLTGSVPPVSLAHSVVAARTLVAGIDLQSPLLTPGNVGLLRALSDKYESYIRQGRGREAHAMAAAMQIAWHMLSEPDIPLDLTDTAHGSLD
jgi:hypothetical protein